MVQYQWQEYNVYPEDKRLTKRIYWSVQRVEDHKPIFQNGQIREGVAPWGDVLVKEISDADFEKYPYAGRDGSNRMSKGLPRRVYARLTLRLDGLNMRLDWDRAPPNFKPYDNGKFTGCRYGDRTDALSRRPSLYRAETMGDHPNRRRQHPQRQLHAFREAAGAR